MMQFQLRFIARPPKVSSKSPTQFVFCAAHARLVVAAEHLLIEYVTATSAVCSTIRLPSVIQKLVYVGSPPTVLAILENGHALAYRHTSSGLQLAHQRSISGPDRPVAFAHGALDGDFVIFCKADSPSVWCLPVHSNHTLGDPFKLRSDIEGLQDNVKFVDGAIAKIRGKVTTKPRARQSPVVALSSHPKLPLVAAAYKNGFIRVWDVIRKEQRMHLDIQPLLGEAIIDVLLHPTFPVVVVCTNQGRIISFLIQQSAFKHTDAPSIRTSVVLLQNRRFLSMAFSSSQLSYLLLLTTSKRVVTRLLNRAGVILPSSRYPKTSQPLTFRSDATSDPTATSPYDDYDDLVNSKVASVFRILADRTFGLVACTMDFSGAVYVYQPWSQGLPIQPLPRSAGSDLPLSASQDDIFTGPVEVVSESIVVHNKVLFSYMVGSEKLTKLCKLPDGDVRTIKVARDNYGYCVGALVFYDGDDLVEPTEYIETLESPRFVLCTKIGLKDDWTVSEPAEGLEGCFLGGEGCHDAVFIIANSGNAASITSFSGFSMIQAETQRQRRGVRRFQIEGGTVSNVFRAPFARWSAVVYHDKQNSRLAVSSNTFIRHSSPDAPKDAGYFYAIDIETALPLHKNEPVLDVRWQNMNPGKTESEDDYFGAILTASGVYIVRNVLEVLHRFDYSTISRSLIPYAPLSFAWAGPSLLLLCGSSLFSISLDGKADFVVGLGNSENMAVLVACLPNRVVYASPEFGGKETTLQVKSRPYGAVSAVLRGALSFPLQHHTTDLQQKSLISHIIEKHDVSQTSPVLAETLLSKGMAGMAYTIVTSSEGKHVISSLKKIAFLAQMGDIRGALMVAEDEYGKLPHGEAFHEGMELYRLVQRVLNMAFIIGDLEICKRCSQLLGRRGTFSSFIAAEGGFDALRAAQDDLSQLGASESTRTLNALLDKSLNSSVASDVGVLPSRREVRAMRQAIAAAQKSSFKLGSKDKRKVLMHVVLVQEELKGPPIVNRIELGDLNIRSISEQLEMFLTKSAAEDFHEIAKSMEYRELAKEERLPIQGESDSKTARTVTGKDVLDSSEEEETYDRSRVKPSEEHAFTEDSRGQPSEIPEQLMPASKGQLTQATEEGMLDTQKRMEQQSARSRAVVEAATEVGQDLIVAQRKVILGGAAAPEMKASELVTRASEKLRNGRVKSSLKDIENGIRAIARGVERGVQIEAHVLKELVMYRLACRLRIAMEEVESSELGTSVAGKVAYAQFATAATRLTLRPEDRVDVLVRAAEASMLLGNFRTAAEGLKMIKDIGVPEGMREGLRERYAVCQTRGFAESVPMPPRIVCFASLKMLPPEIRMMACTVCIAVYAIDSGVVLGGVCEYCQLGRIGLR